MCCFFKNEDTKIQVWIIIDCILNICYGFLLFIVLEFLIGSPGGIVGPIWSFIVIIANIVLLFALKKANTKMMLFWISTTGINISLVLLTAIFFVCLSIIVFFLGFLDFLIRSPEGIVDPGQPVEVTLNKMA